MRKRSMALVGMVSAAVLSLSAASANATGSTGVWLLRNGSSAQCLSIPGGSSAPNGTAAVQYTCDLPPAAEYDDDQEWLFKLVP